MAFFLFAVAILLLVPSSFADTLTTSPEKETGEALSTTATNQSAITGDSLYKMLYENSKENNEKMWSAIQWTLGISLVFLLAIFGSQFFFNWRIGKKEVEKIHEEVFKIAAEQKAELISLQKEENQMATKETKDLIAELKKDLKEAASKQFIAQDKNIRTTMEIARKWQEYFEGKIENSLSRIESRVAKNEGEIWKIRGVESNALSSFVDAALIKIDLNDNPSYLIDDIIKILESISEIHAYTYDRLKELSEKMSSLDLEKKKQLDKLFANKPVYKLRDNPGTGLFGLLNQREYIRNNPLHP